MKRGKLVRGTNRFKGDDRGRFYRCANCGFIVDSHKVPTSQEWHVDYTYYNVIGDEEDVYVLVSEDNTHIIGTEDVGVKPDVIGGCPFCGLGAYK